MQGTYKIAEHTFRIETIHEEAHRLCEDYKTDEPAEFYIKTTAEDIQREREMTVLECAAEHIPFTDFPDSSYEFTAVYRKMTELLFDFDILLFHGSVVSVEGCAYMFIAKSGTGKSTHSRMWRELLGTEAVMVNDDKPLVRITGTEAVAYGTPWNGKHRLGNNIAVPLKGICILNRGTENSIRPVSLPEAYPMLLQQIYRIPDRQHLTKTMELLDTMGGSVRFYTMACNISTDAAKMAYSCMHKGEILP